MLDARRKACLRSMGIELWVDAGRRTSGIVQEPAADPDPGLVRQRRQSDQGLGNGEIPAAVPLSGGAPVEDHSVSDPPRPVFGPEPSVLSWDELRTSVTTCQACELHRTRTQAVFGVGDRNASLMIIGEAPGADEDRQGEPFVGRAGQLLNAMLAAIGFSREQVYIANIIKCRPPGNRDPHVEEASACQAYLYRQIGLLQPSLILSVGRISAHNLLGTEESVGRLRGRTHRFDPGNIPLIVTYHPAYLLRRPQEKAKAWQDLQAVYHLLQQA
jgi:DNA polymerase